ncbi:hypothetical protein [Azotobacter chroococcum]|uniref:hypothetical protein n=1 Tax=Azotobacter chroococcum TaxID=353 RepID=UPI0010ADB63A|nr:hypothetical protein [Azotobacter chroococcum]TKD30027.1 hypothetical protein FCG41_24435 [Azotobacter chroococcum]
MSDLICRKTMMRCQTPGMCSPHGGCSDSIAVNPGAPLPGAILAADHDRIVSALIAGREAAERENESLRSKARASEQAALELHVEVERLQRELATAHADASHYASTAEDMRAEVERLKPLLKEAGEELKEMKESVGYRAHTIGVIQRIDEALENNR